MRDGWEVRTVGSCTTLVRRGKAPSYVESGGVAVMNQKCIRSYNFIDWKPQRRTEPLRAIADELFLRLGDVVICSTGRGTLGRASGISTLSEPTTVDGHVTIVRADGRDALGSYLALVLSNRFDELESLGGGSTNQTELAPSAIANVSFLLPPLPEQRRIVDLVGAFDNALAAADPAPARRAYEAMLAALAAQPDGSLLSRALRQKRDTSSVEAEAEYRILGVLRSGQGFIDRGTIRGADTGYSKMSQVGVDELVYRKLTAWEGPISVCTDLERGGWVSAEFPIFTIDQTVLRPGLMRHFCRWPGFWQRIGDRLVGSVQRRKRLNPEALLGIELPMPPLEVQDAWLVALDSIWEVVAARSMTVLALQRTRNNLLTALLSGEHEIPQSYDELMGEAS